MSGQTVILNGRSAKQLAHAMIEQAPPGAVLNVREASRTLDQNAKLWAMLSDVSRAKPEGRKHTTEMWKALFMKACGHHVQFLEGLDGEPFPVGFRSSRLTKAQMCELIDFIDAWGSERGVRWTEAERVAA